MWVYEGPHDKTRLRARYSDEEERMLVVGMHKILFGGEPSPSFPRGVMPLFNDPERDAIVASMPECNG